MRGDTFGFGGEAVDEGSVDGEGLVTNIADVVEAQAAEGVGPRQEEERAGVEVEGGDQAFKLDEGLGAGDGVALRCTFEVLGHGRVEGQGGGVVGV